jgi:hypothetical protein
LFAGQATAAADTYAGSLARLSIAGNNAKETIGKGLVDALVTASNSTSTDDLIEKIDRAAESIANFVRETGEFIRITKSIFKFELFATDPNAFKGMGNISLSKSSQDTQRADAIAKKNAMGITKLTKDQAANQAKILKDKRLQAAIDKAQLALGKADDIFNMDQIQIGAALTNQAEQLAKTTSGAQVLQIANDTARLNVKRSILNLEEAIASKDEASVIAATAKLNADLQILGALTGQEVKLKEIKSILDGLASKSIGIDVDTTAALNKIKALYASAAAGIVIPVSLSGTATTAGTTTGNTTGAVNIGGLYTAIGENFKEYLVQTGALTSGTKPGGGEFNYSITVNTGIGDPNAIANEIVDFLNKAKANGTLANGILNPQ